MVDEVFIVCTEVGAVWGVCIAGSFHRFDIVALCATITPSLSEGGFWIDRIMRFAQRWGSAMCLSRRLLPSRSRRRLLLAPSLSEGGFWLRTL